MAFIYRKKWAFLDQITVLERNPKKKKKCTDLGDIAIRSQKTFERKRNIRNKVDINTFIVLFL